MGGGSIGPSESKAGNEVGARGRRVQALMWPSGVSLEIVGRPARGTWRLCSRCDLHYCTAPTAVLMFPYAYCSAPLCTPRFFFFSRFFLFSFSRPRARAQSARFILRGISGAPAGLFNESEITRGRYVCCRRVRKKEGDTEIFMALKFTFAAAAGCITFNGGRSAMKFDFTFDSLKIINDPFELTRGKRPCARV